MLMNNLINFTLLRGNYMYCMNCGMKMPNFYTYCSNCGKQLLIKCPNCKTKNPTFYKYCINCGYRINQPTIKLNKYQIERYAIMCNAYLEHQDELEQYGNSFDE